MVISHTWIAGALNSSLAAVRQITGKEVPALGQEALKCTPADIRQELTPTVDLRISKADMANVSSILSRYVIPVHLNVQYVEVF